MSATDGVLCSLEVVVESLRFKASDRVHSLAIEIFDVFINRHIARRVIWTEVKAMSPVTEIGRDHKEVARIGQIFSEYLAIRYLFGRR